MLESFHAENNCLPLISSLEGLGCISVGKSANVCALNARRVVKRYESGIDNGIRTERRVHDRPGHHPNITKFFGALEDNSIVLVLRDLLSQQTDAAVLPFRTKHRWIKHAATGLQHMHDHGIIHSDVRCRNMIITNRSLQLIDFEGFSIDDEGPYSSYEWFSYKPSTPRACIKADIFAVGCAMYEIIRGNPPCHELRLNEIPRDNVEYLSETNQFPSVSDLPLGDLISDCWHGNFGSMHEVVERIEEFRT